LVFPNEQRATPSSAFSGATRRAGASVAFHRVRRFQRDAKPSTARRAPQVMACPFQGAQQHGCGVAPRPKGGPPMPRSGVAMLDRGLPFHPSVRKRHIHVPLLPAHCALSHGMGGPLKASNTVEHYTHFPPSGVIIRSCRVTTRCSCCLAGQKNSPSRAYWMSINRPCVYRHAL
jgi:hypothetical protein